jgi:hypothetical protein
VKSAGRERRDRAGALKIGAWWGVPLFDRPLLFLVVLACLWLATRAVPAAVGSMLAWRPPPRSWLEVSVPATADVAAAEAMNAWWSRVVHAGHGSRLRGRGQVELLHVLTGSAEGAHPTLETYVGGDPTAIDTLRRELAQQFAGAATIRRVEDPLADAANAVRGRVRARLPRRLRRAGA